MTFSYLPSSNVLLWGVSYFNKMEKSRYVFPIIWQCIHSPSESLNHIMTVCTVDRCVPGTDDVMPADPEKTNDLYGFKLFCTHTENGSKKALEIVCKKIVKSLNELGKSTWGDVRIMLYFST